MENQEGLRQRKNASQAKSKESHDDGPLFDVNAVAKHASPTAKGNSPLIHSNDDRKENDISSDNENTDTDFNVDQPSISATDGETSDDSFSDNEENLLETTTSPGKDDILLIVAALSGFFVFSMFAIIVSQYGVDRSFVMGGGLMSFLAIALYLSFFKGLDEAEDTAIFFAFLIASCFGVMLGGMLGGIPLRLVLSYHFPSLISK